jgi:hypothetical protein
MDLAVILLITVVSLIIVGAVIVAALKWLSQDDDCFGDLGDDTKDDR